MPTRKLSLVLVFTIGLFAGVIQSAEKDGPALGSIDWHPSPQNPVGWRGDWTGRFPGATPPLNWSRRVKGITTELRYQANKPAGEPGKDSKPLEYFTIKDWLVAGPFSLQDPVADLEKDFLNGEAAIHPAQGDKAGESAWKFLRADMESQSRHDHNEGTCGQSYVDFLYTFGTITVTKDKIDVSGDFVNKAAYAHTYVWSPAEAKVRLQIPFTGEAGRFWLNGAPTKLEKNSKAYDVSLNKGWNRLLVKVTVADGLGKNYDGRWLSKWLVAAYITPIPPVSYETKNIKWMTKLTGRSMSQPIIVGGKIFVGSGISDLICLNKTDGKILWIQSSAPWDAMSADEQSALPIKDVVAPALEKLKSLNAQVIAAINAAVSAQGLSSDQEAELDKLLKTKLDTERSIHTAFAKLDRKKYPAMSDNEVASSNPTPVSDGTHVFWVCGGGMKGPGAYVFSCFDFDGKRVWSTHDALGASEHGNHGSPSLADGKLIYTANKLLIAYDQKTGKELWRASSKDWQNEYCGTSAVIAKIGAEHVIVGKRYLHRMSDGSEICSNLLEPGLTETTPIVEKDMLYNPFRWRGWKEPMSFISVKLPASTAASVKAEAVWAPEGKDVSMALRGPIFAIASPLYLNGIVYSIEMSGGLAAVDVEGKKLLYRRWLDGYNRYNRYLYGVAASPMLGGKHIFITDDAGYTHIIEPGPEFKESGKNILENIHFSGLGGNPCHQESFYTSPYFEGKCLYLRGEDYLYCIEEK
ncbi:MAG TPA: PQQ-binding-like beta-propeller repeat protein [Planctomycetota bacterium]|nr:PQQ-binding-like beta-propeller repeat protein [Planctomycetota bacterium]